jgi:DNA-directed RNA polymerase subunit beta'
MLEVNNFSAIRISLASPDQIRGGRRARSRSRDHQSLDPQAREGWALRRRIFADQGLGVLLRQYKRIRYKGIICGAASGHPLEGPSRADGPHPAQPGQPYLVLQGHASRLGILPTSARATSSGSCTALYIVTHVDEDARAPRAAIEEGPRVGAARPGFRAAREDEQARG